MTNTKILKCKGSNKNNFKPESQKSTSAYIYNEKKQNMRIDMKNHIFSLEIIKIKIMLAMSNCSIVSFS